ncbi:MAG: DUF1512 family protein [Candidatus Ranarchaeia archaeon]
MQLPFDPTAMLFQVLWLAVIIFLSMQSQKLQLSMWMGQIRKALLKLKGYSNHAQEITLQLVKDFGKPSFDPKSRIEEYLDFLFIQPVSLDPAGVLKRLEHLLDVRNQRFRDLVKIIAPNANKVDSQKIENTLEATIAINQTYRIVRHFYIMGRKTNNIYSIMAVHMQLAEIMKISKAYTQALKAFANGTPIGDGLGPFVVAKIVDEVQYNKGKTKNIKNVAQDIMTTELTYEERNLLLVRAEGPGATVGKPGEAIKELIKQRKGKISRVITIDAGIKLEGDTTGGIVEGVGAAIGDPGPEKHKIESFSEQSNIPVDALMVKESIEEAVTPMRKQIAEAADKVVERLKRVLRERTKKGDTVIVAGIGNTIGIG